MKQLHLSENFDDYILEAFFINESNNLKLRIKHSSGGKHFADHTQVQVLDSNLNMVGSENINTNNIINDTSF